MIIVNAVLVSGRRAERACLSVLPGEVRRIFVTKQAQVGRYVGD